MSQLLISFRNAGKADSRFLLSLRNSPEVRLQSRNKGEIDSRVHSNWFDKALESGLETILIITLEQRAAGYLRASTMPDFTLVSVALSDSLRGKGLCAEILLDALKLIEGRKLRAEILEGNAASLSCFKKAGFQTISLENGLYSLELTR